MKYDEMFKTDIHAAGNALAGLVKYGVVKDVDTYGGIPRIEMPEDMFFEMFDGAKKRDKRYSSEYEEMYVEFDGFEVFTTVRKVKDEVTE